MPKKTNEPVNSSRDPAQPDADELYVDSTELTEEKMNSPFGKKLFPRDGRGSSSRNESPSTKRAVISNEEPGATSESSIREGADAEHNA